MPVAELGVTVVVRVSDAPKMEGLLSDEPSESVVACWIWSTIKTEVPKLPPLSVARKVRFAATPAVGVPVIAPVAAFRLSPAGSVPEATVQVLPPSPPVALSVWL